MRYLMLASCALVLLATSAVQGTVVVITSDEFSLGYGATETSGNAWTTSETSGANTATTLGDFSFEPAPYALNYSQRGPTFPGRVLTDGTETSRCAWVNPAFTIPVVAKYNGAAPADASATPDYHLVIDITSLNIYSNYTAATGTPTTLAWEEVTAGHTQTSPSLALPEVGGAIKLASNYAHLVWDAGDYSASLAGLNDAVTRTFDVSSPGDEDNRAVEGFEVIGRVSLVYNNAVPEPSALVLLGLGLFGLLAYAWRKRK